MAVNEGISDHFHSQPEPPRFKHSNKYLNISLFVLELCGMGCPELQNLKTWPNTIYLVCFILWCMWFLNGSIGSY